MRAILILLIIVVLVAIAAISLGYINVSQTRTASLPSIKVEGGAPPAFDVQAANVSVGSEKHVVETPVINVQKP